MLHSKIFSKMSISESAIYNETQVQDKENRDIDLNLMKISVDTSENELFSIWDNKKKLLVIDTDHKFLHDLEFEVKNEVVKPRYYLQEFLRKTFRYFNIVFWCSDSVNKLEAEMTSLGVNRKYYHSSKYGIALCLGKESLVTHLDGSRIKHPMVIWERFPGYSPSNTIIITSNGVNSNRNIKKDDDLKYLSEYLQLIHNVEDFQRLNHSKWQKYRRLKRNEEINKCIRSIDEILTTYEFKQLTPFRDNKKLLVLDIDCTIFGVYDQPLKRPGLDDFLKRVYENYDIAIWSARRMESINIVLKWLGITNSENYRLGMIIDREAMIRVVVDGKIIRTKCLQVLWEKKKQYSSQNTILLDDQKINFLMEPRSGLQVKAFPQAGEEPSEDRELTELAQYLELIANVHDFGILDHNNWQEYIKLKSSETPEA